MTGRRTLGYGAGNFSVNLLAQTFATFATFYYVDELGVAPHLIGLAMVIHGVVAALCNPLAGHLSDRTRSRFGRRVPYMAFGTVPLAAAFTMLWLPPADTSTGRFWYFLGVVLVYDVLFVVVVLNYTALFPEMFGTTAERARASSWRQLFGIAGMILGVAAAPLVYGSLGWPGMGLLFGAVAAVFLGVAVRSSAERTTDAPPVQLPLRAALRQTLVNRSFVTYVAGSFCLQLTVALFQAGVPFYTKYVLGEPDSANTLILGALFATALPAVFGWSRAVTTQGPRRAMLATTAVFAVSLAPFLVVRGLPAAVATGALVGVAVAGMLVLLDIMLADVIDEDERRTGTRREGMYFGVNGFVVRWTVSLQALLTGAALSAGGYRSGAADQPGSAEWAIRILLGGLPLVILPLALACFVMHPLRDRPGRRADDVHETALVGPAGLSARRRPPD